MSDQATFQSQPMLSTQYLVQSSLPYLRQVFTKPLFLYLPYTAPLCKCMYRRDWISEHVAISLLFPESAGSATGETGPLRNQEVGGGQRSSGSIVAER